MKLLKVCIPNNANIFLYGDDHVGTILRYDKGFEKLANVINAAYGGVSNNYGVESGDPLECIFIDDKRFAPEYSQDGRIEVPSVFKQLDFAEKVRRSFKDKIKVILDSNHNDKVWRIGNVTGELCRRLGVPFGTFSCKISWVDKKDRLIFKSFHTHGRKSITSTADDPKRRNTNRELVLKRQLKFKMGDCILMTKGHTHQLIICKPDKELFICDDSKKLTQHYTESEQTAKYIHPDHRWYVNTGSFLRLYGEDMSGYAEKAEYDPMELGFAIAKIRDRKFIGVDKVFLQKEKL